MSFFSSVFGTLRTAFSSSSEMRHVAFLNIVIRLCLGFIILLLPFWFLPLTLDVLDMNKQTLLVFLTLLAGIAWLVKGFLLRSFSFVRSGFLFTASFCLLGYAVISLFSQDRYLSFVGISGQYQWSFLTVASFVLFSFLLLQELRERSHVFFLLRWFLVGVLLVEIYGILGVFPLPWGPFLGNGFTTIGTLNGLAVFLIAPLVLTVGLLGVVGEEALPSQKQQRVFWKGIFWTVLVLGLALLILLDYWASWVGLAFGMAFLAGIPWFSRRAMPSSVLKWMPVALFVLATVLLFVRLPFSPAVSSEVFPSMRHSWTIAYSALRDMPLVGSGPGTWGLDYARYRSVESNMGSPFWNVPFARGASSALMLLPTMGLLGVVIVTCFVLFLLAQSGAFLSREKEEPSWRLAHLVLSGWVVTIVLAFLYPYALSHFFVFWFLGALLASVCARDSFAQRTRSIALGTMASFGVLVGVMVLVVGLWLVGQRYMADVRYAQAAQIPVSATSIDSSLMLFSRAATLNPFVDYYHRTLSHASVARSLRLFSSASDATDPSPFDETEVQRGIGMATASAARAIQRSPANGENWASAASVYEALVRVMPDADLQAIAHLEQAIMRAPTNPVLMTRLGQVLLLRAEVIAQTASAASSEETRLEADAAETAALRGAEEWFTRALTMKGDYVTARFSLGVTFDRQGRTEEAITLLEEARQASPEDMSIRWALADAYEHAGKFDEAIAQVQSILDAHPENPTLTTRLQALTDAKQNAGSSASATSDEESDTRP